MCNGGFKKCLEITLILIDIKMETYKRNLAPIKLYKSVWQNIIWPEISPSIIGYFYTILLYDTFVQAMFGECYF